MSALLGFVMKSQRPVPVFMKELQNAWNWSAAMDLNRG